MKETETAQKVVGRIARRQYGLITSRQLDQAGLNRNARQLLVRQGWLHPVRQNVYRLCGVQPTWRSTALAAVLAAGDDAVLSHYSAAALWELLDPEDLEGGLEITAPRLVRISGVVAHRHVLRRADQGRRSGIPTTGIERTLIDLSEHKSSRALGRLIDDVVRRDLTTIGRLELATERHRRRGGRSLGSVRDALGQRGASYDPGANDWEQEMDRLWEEMGLPPSERQYPILLPSGRKVVPDRVILDARITIEWDGYEYHGRRSDFERDLERRNELIAAGWTPLDFHSHQSPDEICRTVLAVYAAKVAA